MDTKKYEVIRKKGSKYHSKPSIYAMALHDKGCFEYCSDRMKKPRIISFDYVEWKALRLSAWCMLNNVSAPAWYENMKGKIIGFKTYIEIVDRVEWHCKLTGLKCDALLDERLIEYEGFKVTAMLGDKPYSGLLERSGKGIQYHFIKKDGKQSARYIKPYEVTGISIL